MGRQGAGKTQVVNVVTGQQDVARSFGGTGRGTFVAHEFLAAQDGQTEMFRIEPCYKSNDELRKNMEAHVSDIYRAHTATDRQRALEVKKQKAMACTSDRSDDPSDEESDDDTDGDLDPDDLTDICRKNVFTYQYYTTMFCDKDDFSSIGATRSFFAREHAKGTAQSALVHMLFEQVKVFRSSQRSDRVRTACDSKELHRITDDLSEPNHSNPYQKPHPWPITKKIRIYFNAPLLQAGLILGDTPGANDDDSNVVANTWAYLDEASTVFVFTEALRGETGLDEILLKCLASKKRKTIYLLCNKTDQIPLLAPHEVDQLEDPDLRGKMVSIQEDIACLRQKGQIADSLRDAEAQEQLLSIDYRVQDLRNNMKDKLRELDGSKRQPELKVVAISAEHGYGVSKFLDLLYERAAEGKFLALYRLAYEKLPNMINGIIGTLVKIQIDGTQAIQAILDSAKSRRGMVLHQVLRDINAGFDKHIATVFKFEKIWCKELKGKFGV